MAECPRCAAVTYLPLAYAWPMRSVACLEWGSKMPLGLDELTKLKAQATAAAAEIGRQSRVNNGGLVGIGHRAAARDGAFA